MVIMAIVVEAEMEARKHKKKKGRKIIAQKTIAPKETYPPNVKIVVALLRK